LASQIIETFNGTNKASQVINNYTTTPIGDKHIFTYLSQTDANDFLKNNTVRTFHVYDLDGNLTNQASYYIPLDDAPNRSSTQKDFSTFDKYGNPGTITTVMLRNSEPAFVQQQTLTYNPLGQINNTTLNGNTTSFTYDDFGNPLTVTSSATGLEDRVVTSEYDENGRFPIKKYNPLNHTTESFYDDFGDLTSRKNANGLETKNVFDSWGRVKEVISPDNEKTVHSVKWVAKGDVAAPKNALYCTETTIYEGKDQKSKFAGAEYFDLLGRSLRKITTGFDGAKFYTDYTYNEKGQVTEVTDPYPADGTASKKTSYAYDDYGRALSNALSNGVTKSYSYDNNKVTTNYSTGEEYSKTYDAAGLLINATDPGGAINYYYTSTGKTRRIKSPGSVITMTYDETNCQKTLVDPNTGTTTYGYNAFGELTSQTDVMGKLVTMDYDKLGRVLTKTVEGVATSYTYDDPKALGMLKSVTRTEGTDVAGMSYTYDDLLRIIKKTKSKGSESFAYQYEYDDISRLSKLTYPNSFALTYEYNEHDDLKAVYNAADPADTHVAVWEFDAVNAKGQLQTATYGNGNKINYGYDDHDRLNHIVADGIIDFNYQFNDKQQLTSRDEKYMNGIGIWEGLHEEFTYDEVNRLKTATGVGPQLQMTYASAENTANDRIAAKSDAGTYTYQAGNHRVSELAAVTGYQPPKHDITYTDEGMIATLTETNNGVVNKVLTFEYGIDNKRFKAEYTEDGTRKYTRYYFGSYEKEIQVDGTERNLNYIYANGSLVAIYEQMPTGDAMHYVYTDYLGSLRCITDASGNVEQKLGFDAWGNRRDPVGGGKTSLSPMLFARGFSGHEHLEEFGLINMNGRMYDPLLGMFISPDNYIQAPDFTQNFNRYTYCLNNPLMYTDPSGEYIPFFVIPTISWSPKGGFGVSISAGVGFYKGLSAQVTIGYAFKSNNLWGTVGASYSGVTAYTGYGTKSGWFEGVSVGFGSFNGFSSNITSAGISYSQNGGWSGNLSCFQYNQHSGWSVDPSVSYSHTFYLNDPNSAKNRALRAEMAEKQLHEQMAATIKLDNSSSGIDMSQLKGQSPSVLPTEIDEVEVSPSSEYESEEVDIETLIKAKQAEWEASQELKRLNNNSETLEKAIDMNRQQLKLIDQEIEEYGLKNVEIIETTVGVYFEVLFYMLFEVEFLPVLDNEIFYPNYKMKAPGPI
jgi:RHS repeat-associated protein